MSSPIRSFTWGTNTQCLSFLGSNGHAYTLLMTRPGSSDWLPFDITTAAPASTNPSFPVPANAQSLAGYGFTVLDKHGQTIEDTVHMIYLGEDGFIHEAYAEGNTSSLAWNDHALTAASQPLGLATFEASPTSPLGGYAFVVYNKDGSARESTEHVIYLDTSGTIHNLQFTPGETWSDERPDILVHPLLNNAVATPIAAYPFVAYYPDAPIEATEHIIYIDTNHLLHELWKPTGSAFWSDNVLPGNPLVLDDLVTPLSAYTLFAVDGNGILTEVSEHVIYVGSDNALHELYNVRQPYQSGWLDVVLYTHVPPLISAVQITPLAGFSLFSANILTTTADGNVEGTAFDIQEISEHVIYIGSDGSLRELYNVISGTPGWVDHALPTAAAPLFIVPTFSGSAAKTTPVAAHSFIVHGNDGSLLESTMHVFYVDQNLNLHEMYYDVPNSGGWMDRNLTQDLGIQPAM